MGKRLIKAAAVVGFVLGASPLLGILSLMLPGAWQALSMSWTAPPLSLVVAAAGTVGGLLAWRRTAWPATVACFSITAVFALQSLGRTATGIAYTSSPLQAVLGAGPAALGALILVSPLVLVVLGRREFRVPEPAGTAPAVGWKSVLTTRALLIGLLVGLLGSALGASCGFAGAQLTDGDPGPMERASAPAGAVSGFVACFAASLWCLKVVGRRSGGRGPAFGALFGGMAGGVSGGTTGVFRAFAELHGRVDTANIVFSAIVGALAGLVTGILCGIILALIVSAIDQRTKKAG